MGAKLTIGLGATFLGYSIGYYGLTQVKSGNWGYWDLTNPVQWAKKKDIPRDKGAGGSSPSNPAQSKLNQMKSTVMGQGLFVGSIPIIGPIWSWIKGG